MAKRKNYTPVEETADLVDEVEETGSSDLTFDEDPIEPDLPEIDKSSPPKTVEEFAGNPVPGALVDIRGRVYGLVSVSHVDKNVYLATIQYHDEDQVKINLSKEHPVRFDYE